MTTGLRVRWCRLRLRTRVQLVLLTIVAGIWSHTLWHDHQVNQACEVAHEQVRTGLASPYSIGTEAQHECGNPE